MNYTTLEKNKKLVMKARKKDIFMLAIWTVFMLPLLVALPFVKDWRVVICLLFFIVFPVIIIKTIINDNRLIKQISFVEDNKKINKTYNVKLDNPRFFFLSDGGTKTSKHCYGIGLKSKDKKKYYILFDGLKFISYYEDLETLVSIFSREFTLQCYEGTTIVKTVDNAPFCFEDKYTPVYKPFIKNKR